MHSKLHIYFRNQTVIALSVVLIIIFVLNCNTPLIGEDFGLSLHLSDQNLELSAKLLLILKKIYAQYTAWNSRLGEQWAIMTLAFDKSIFNVINCVAYYLFCYMTVLYGTGKKCSPLHPAIPLVACLVLLLIPRFGEIFMWQTGSANYLHAILILLVFCIPYRLYRSEKEPSFGVWKLMVFCFLGFLAGMTNENTVPAFIAFISLLAALNYRRLKRARSLWFLFGFISLSAGYLCLILSPSTKIRVDTYKQIFGVGDITPFLYVDRAKTVIMQFFSSSYLLVICVALFAVIWLIPRRTSLKQSNNSELHKNITLIACSLISLFMLALPPYFEVRAFLLFWFFLFAIVAFFFDESLKYKYQMHLLPPCLILVVLSQAGTYFREYKFFYNESMARHSDILRQRASGKSEIRVRRFQTSSSRVLNTREVWLIDQPIYAIYYGVKSITIE